MALTPERLQRIRAYAARALETGERTSWDPAEIIELVDEILRLESEAPGQGG